MSSTRRITKEFGDITQSPPNGYSVSLGPNDSLHTWHVTLLAPAGSVFHPGRFGLVLTLPVEYPFRAPSVRFVTRIYHPNVTNDSLGNVCLALLKPENWKPSTKVAAVLEALRGLLLEPLPDDPLEDRIAEQFRNDRAAFDKAAKDFVERYAMGEPTFPPAATAA
ncbi:Ubiquitin-conjugating enzyme/RWD-like protein [Cordyceps fumosorosea ARSEF 2679]|uniref:E2 ubiquitin-conjugating enzyme n=1 Tax=Cordyceps fumosorosea (strain ARSEF 2679) TaxID=1081104 RepID=A0A167D183_CORFA|nr:Ubiquitin-conjugating enzyme/RWD-like protein [Cordyceps fumosorosea ARSEF 2679]OAA41825.1 Ubiquitin-conjugating enzyme/RWD-like protein [Cordyceps fumosorosea ARSEF 2679]